MVEPYWKCPVCGFEARNEEEKQKHMQGAENEPAHVEHMKRTGKKET